jgi:hypothetical protein
VFLDFLGCLHCPTPNETQPPVKPHEIYDFAGAPYVQEV